MTPEELEGIREDIRARVLDRPGGEWADPQLLPDLFAKTLDELGHLAVDPTSAVDGDQPGYSKWAARLLRSFQHRAVSGVPFGEEVPAEQPWERTLDELDMT